jgi:hypothetical protein
MSWAPLSSLLPVSAHRNGGMNNVPPIALDGLKRRQRWAGSSVALGGEARFGSFSIAQRGWIDPDQLREIYRERMAHPARANLGPLWSVMELEMWSKECLGGR